jgi:threonine dehydrogenase-like Zn-dependent dehydrogenase
MGTMCPNRQMGFLMPAERAPHFHGGFAEYAYVRPKAGRLRVPDDVESEWAAAASCALRTVVGAFERLGPIDFLSSVLIQGSGPLGLFATALAALYRPKRLVVVGAPAARLEIAREWGAHTVISVEDHPDPQERAALIAEHTDGGPDVLFELSGARGAFAEGVRVAGRDARYAVAGTLGPGTQDVEVSRITTRGLRITGCLGGDIGTYYKALELLEREARSFNWDALFSGRRHGLSYATAALQAQRAMTEIKPVVDPWGEP